MAEMTKIKVVLPEHGGSYLTFEELNVGRCFEHKGDLWRKVGIRGALSFFDFEVHEFTPATRITIDRVFSTITITAE